MISLHRNQCFHQSAYGQGFQAITTVDLRRIASAITRFVWSPIVWREGQRRQSNFESAYFAVLDFDDGSFTLEDAKNSFCDVCHVIGTTRSHQVEKSGKPACDRFRVLLELEHPIIDLRSYRYNMSTLCARYTSDEACKDGARFFYPCMNIVSIVTDGDLWPVEKVPSHFENPESKAPAEKLARLNWLRYRELAPWCAKFLKYGKPFENKGRELSAFMVASQMRLAGLSEDEAYSLLLTAPIDKTDFDAERELLHAVRSAYKK